MLKLQWWRLLLDGAATAVKYQLQVPPPPPRTAPHPTSPPLFPPKGQSLQGQGLHVDKVLQADACAAARLGLGLARIGHLCNGIMHENVVSIEKLTH